MVSPNQQRAAADYLGEHYRISQRRICRVLGRSRSILRYRRKHRADEPALNREIKRLARRHPRYGYRFIHALLVRRGWTINLKRVRRLWIELGLNSGDTISIFQLCLPEWPWVIFQGQVIFQVIFQGHHTDL